MFSLAPLVLLLLAVVGFLFQKDPAGAWQKLTGQMSYFLDKSAPAVVSNIAQKASQPNKGLLATIFPTYNQPISRRQSYSSLPTRRHE